MSCSAQPWTATPAAAQGSKIAHRIDVADHRRQPEARAAARRRRRRPRPPTSGARASAAASAPGGTGPPPTRVTGPEAAVDAGVEACQSRITTAETLFFGEPSMSLSE